MINKILKITFIYAFLIAMSNPVCAKKGNTGSSADYRSAKSGQYVKKDYAERNKASTVREQRRKN
jgi:outer membrane protein assembly factor BamE (lipoprotein component of BamABCDE complex)